MSFRAEPESAAESGISLRQGFEIPRTPYIFLVPSLWIGGQNFNFGRIVAVFAEDLQ